MRLAAVYIQKNSLKHILGEEHEGVTLNFGGSFFYNVEYKESNIKDENAIKIERTKNERFIEDFYSDKISLITALAGQNGSGKTTILKCIKNSNEKSFFIYEHLGMTYLEYRTDGIFHLEEVFNQLLNIEFNLDGSYENDRILNEFDDNRDMPNPSVKDISKIKYLYYSVFSNYDYNLRNVDDFIVKHHDNDIININKEIRERQIKFLYNFNLIEKLKYHFKDFPSYDSLVITLDDKLIKQYQSHDEYILKKELGTDKDYFYQLNYLYKGVDSDQSRIFISLYYRFLYSFLMNSNLPLAKVIGKIENVIEEQIELIKNQSFNSEIFKNFVYSFKNAVEFKSVNFDEAANFLNNDISTFLGIKVFGDIEFNDLADFLSSYSRLISMFERNNRDNKIDNSLYGFLKIKADKNLSLGEESLLNFFASIYENGLSLNNINSVVLLLDEPELGFHPEWKKKFINAIVQVLPELYNDLQSNIENIQIIFSTHDPLTLSDLPNYNIIYINKKKSGHSNIYYFNDPDRPSKSFAANITDLLADSFFIEDGLMGDFAKGKIKEVVSWLDNKNDKSNHEKYRKTIEIIDETIVQRKLSEMYDFKIEDNLRVRIIEKQINYLNELKNKIT